MKLFSRTHPDTGHDAAIRGWAHSARTDGLTEAEAERGRALLAEYMAMKPARAPAARGRMLPLAALHPRAFAAALAVVLVTVSLGGTAYAAEDALPGDALYAFKLDVNEQVQGAFALTDESKADWSLERARRRLEEASTLALTGRLTPEASASLEQNLNASLADAESHASTLADQHDAVAAANVAISANALLSAHASVLAAIQTTVPTSGPTRAQLGSLLADVTTHLETSSSRAQTLADAPAATATVAAQRTAAKAKIDTATELLSAATGQLSLDVHPPVDIWSGAKAQLKEAQAAYTNGEGSAAADDTAAASGNFNTALEAASGVAATVSARVHVLDVLQQTGALGDSDGDNVRHGSDHGGTAASTTASETATASTTSAHTDAGATSTASTTEKASSTIMMRTMSAVMAPAAAVAASTTASASLTADSVLDALQKF